MNEEITLKQFTSDLRKQVQDFQDYWEKNRWEENREKDDKSSWPKKLLLADWQEQFLFYHSEQ